ncbi:TlpA family protein disulfide reductase [Catenovulum agarivorans]|uniref:TlpA family protein disulfide reductase n=1 Tax=Catenovulum agarivorans TaxID=1172192 RepID=UPI000382A387|nr:redoxin domain-containing protein [Catenovulum agarivorans]
MWLKRIAKWAYEAIFIILIMVAIFWFQSRNMLESGHQIDQLTVQGQIDHNLTIQLAEVNIQLQNNKKPTLVYFIAPWCSVCHISINNLQSLYMSHQREVNLLVVALSYQTVDEVKDFVAKHELSFPVYLGEQSVAEAFNVSAFPSYYWLDETGTVTAKAMGYTTETELKLKHWFYF